MMCTSATPFLSIGLAKNNKIMSMFVLFSWLFGHFEIWLFFENGETNLTLAQSNKIFLVNFSKEQQK